MRALTRDYRQVKFVDILFFLQEVEGSIETFSLPPAVQNSEERMDTVRRLKSAIRVHIPAEQRDEQLQAELLWALLEMGTEDTSTESIGPVIDDLKLRFEGKRKEGLVNEYRNEIRQVIANARNERETDQRET